MKKTWYVIAYDIVDPKRLRRTHRLLRSEAMALQQSVYAFHATERELGALLSKLETKMNLREDDLRAWPIPHPGALWYIGNFRFDGALHTDESTWNKPNLSQRILNIFRREATSP